MALEGIKGHKTADETATEYGVHPTQIAQWKKQALDGLPELFSTRRSEQAKSEGLFEDSRGIFSHSEQLS